MNSIDAVFLGANNQSVGVTLPTIRSLNDRARELLCDIVGVPFNLLDEGLIIPSLIYKYLMLNYFIQHVPATIIPVWEKG
jgi:hypothetical protein